MFTFLVSTILQFVLPTYNWRRVFRVLRSFFIHNVLFGRSDNVAEFSACVERCLNVCLFSSFLLLFFVSCMYGGTLLDFLLWYVVYCWLLDTHSVLT